MGTIAEVLDRAADLIEPEGAWAQSAIALDGERRPTYARSRDARCWCAYGAIIKAGGGHMETGAASDAVAPRVGSIIQYNDTLGRTQAEVVAKLREAAAKAREQGL